MAMRRAFSSLLSVLVAVGLSACGVKSQTPDLTATNSPIATTASPIMTITPAPTPSPSPSSSPSPTVEPATPSPEPEDEAADDPYHSVYTKAGLSPDQFARLHDLVDGALYMRFFSRTSNLRDVDLLRFIYGFLGWRSADIYEPDMDFSQSDDCIISISPTTAKRLVDSAFSKKHTPLTTIVNSDVMKYRDGMYHFDISDVLYRTWSKIYRIEDEANGQYKVYMNLVFRAGDGGNFEGKAVATVRKDESSIFDFHILSLIKTKEPKLKVESVTSSSYIPRSGKKTYIPPNVIDNKDNTAWATRTGINEWIQLNFSAPQRVSGMILRLGDWTNESVYDKSGMPYNVTVEFSDGTVEDIGLYNSYMDYKEPYELFHKEVVTSYIRITIRDVQFGDDLDEGSGPIYISEISPF